jgi:hypothetical protein
MVYYRKEHFKGIKLVLKVDLRHLHHTLRKWPDPPTFSATLKFGAMHTSQVKDTRQKIIRHQLEFAAFLSEATFLPEGDEFSGALSSLLPSDSTFRQEDRVRGIDLETPQNGAVYEPTRIVAIEDRDEKQHPVWIELTNLLLNLPRTLRLSHLLQELEHIHKITTSSAFPKFATFRSDIESVLDLAKELDKRLLSENYFSKDVEREM